MIFSITVQCKRRLERHDRSRRACWDKKHPPTISVNRVVQVVCLFFFPGCPKVGSTQWCAALQPQQLNQARTLQTKLRLTAKAQPEPSCVQDSQPGQALSSFPLPAAGLWARSCSAPCSRLSPAGAQVSTPGCGGWLPATQGWAPTRDGALNSVISPFTPRIGSLGPAWDLCPEDKRGLYLQGSL